MAESQTYKLEIDATQLADAQAFEDARKEAYAAGDERVARLGELVSTTTIDGSSIGDLLLEKLTRPDAQEELDAAEAHLDAVTDRIARKHNGFQFEFDEAGVVQAISRIDAVKTDKRAENRAMEMAQRMPSGPKKNGSSFRSNIVDPGRIRGNN